VEDRARRDGYTEVHSFILLDATDCSTFFDAFLVGQATCTGVKTLTTTGVGGDLDARGYCGWALDAG
jgi:hypothetical protein